MGNYYTTTSPPGFLLLLVLVLLSTSTSTTSPAAAAEDYCGSTKVSDPNFPGYVDYALKMAIYKLVTENDSGAGITYPPRPEGSATSAAYCSLKDSNQCNICLNQLLPFVNQCSSYDSGSASNDQKCSLSFHN
ncbi:hypothetical protein LINGRAHAP2_LOCUS36572 [Linum grandiflorum]